MLQLPDKLTFLSLGSLEHWVWVWGLQTVWELWSQRSRLGCFSHTHNHPGVPDLQGH